MVGWCFFLTLFWVWNKETKSIIMTVSSLLKLWICCHNAKLKITRWREFQDSINLLIFVGIESMYLTNPENKSSTYIKMLMQGSSNPLKNLWGLSCSTPVWKKPSHWAVPGPSSHQPSPQGGQNLGHWQWKHQGIYVKCLIHNVCYKTWCMCHMYV